ncbi:MAG: prenyltransferase/squalene oxidase repeat-containing protein, partial [Nitrospirales bacterium]
MGFVGSVLKPLRSAKEYLLLPAEAKRECQHDRAGLPDCDPGPDRVIDEAMAWLGRAQDCSSTHDGGVARHYSLIDGWGASYPETTGYIIPTMLAYSHLKGDEVLRQRARRMLDWLLAIQLPNGGFQAGTVDARPVVPTTFNTGQILLGLASGVQEFDDQYREPLRRAAEWLVKTQDPDGCWRKHPSPFAEPGEKAYETHVAWGLMEAARVENSREYGEAALANVRWALQQQQENGWFAKCCLSDPTQPLTHTIGYVLRGIVEAYRFSKETPFLQASRKTADGLLSVLRADGFLPGRLDPQWHGTVSWACLTGTVQIAHCWLLLFQETGDTRYREAAFVANRYVRRSMRLEGLPSVRGGIKGSFPVDGLYGTYEYL